jgi:hypothetical protein
MFQLCQSGMYIPSKARYRSANAAKSLKTDVIHKVAFSYLIPMLKFSAKGLDIVNENP